MAMFFDGTNDIITHTDIAALDAPTAMTIAAWVRPIESSGASNQQVLCKKAAATGFSWNYADADITAWRFDTTNTTTEGHTATAALTTNVWDHWIWVYDGAGAGNATRLICYKNGVAQSLTFSGTIPATNLVDSTTAVFTVGGGQAGYGFSTFDMEHLKVWTVALSATEALLESRQDKPQSQLASLILWATYDDAALGADYSASGFHGTVSGSVASAGKGWVDEPLRLGRIGSRRSMFGFERRNMFRRLGPFVPNRIHD